MKSLQTTSLRVEHQTLWILDQQALPQQHLWLAAETTEKLIEHIHQLRVRGAPLIGLSASLLLALQASQGLEQAQINNNLSQLRVARPTAINLNNNLIKMEQALNSQGNWRQNMQDQAWQLVEQDRQLCERIANAGAPLIKPSSRILTHCNTGGLASAGIGTALGVIKRSWQQGQLEQVWVSETRPLLQGGRLTTWELKQAGIRCQLIADNMAAALMAVGQVDAIWVGADRIAANGDVANKIGTYNLAVLANFHHIPFYVAAPITTVDPDCASGAKIPIEQRDSREITGVSGSFGQVQWAPKDIEVWNPAFDVTPAALISGWILDTGVITPQQVEDGRFSRPFTTIDQDRRG